MHETDSTRPCFLVIDREYPGNISTRKLVIETAKYNVITAYNWQEAVAMLRKFPRVDGVVLDAEVENRPCTELVAELREVHATVPIVVTSNRGYLACGDVQYQLESYEPGRLLEVLRSLFPGESEALMLHEKRLG